jgi:FkbM family methyltransferase
MKTFETEYGKITCFENDIYFVEQLSKGKVFDQDMVEKDLQQYIQKADTILDIGAHVGCHTVMYANLNSNANIYSFEPQSKLFSLLEQNVIQNNIRNVTLLNNAVGNEIKTVHMESFITDGPNANQSFQYDGNTLYNLGGLSLGEQGEPVSMITIDSLNLMGCDYMKIDVEGAERMVLIGARNTIRKYKPVICYEYNYKHVPSTINMNSHDIIKSLGNYNIIELDNYNFLALPV